MRNIITEKLSMIEKSQGVKIIYACESGSRAWGFASPDSDYDVRFIYIRPLNDYLSIAERRDVIELPVNEVLDIGGWDLRKALQLFLKSNAPLYEWIQSPIHYIPNNELKGALLTLANKYFSARAGCHHYISMAKNTFENDLQGEQVRIKKYFYALRPLLAAKWIIEKSEVPPMEFHILRTLINDLKWQESINALLLQKQAADEKTTISPVMSLQQWIADTIQYCNEKAATLLPLKNDTNELDALFRKYIRHYDL
ncbi:nucleotidyltransferase domain-containing protein [Chitinophaga sp.]|uniref:nucleotidyltransferase domain-containing protein n=1 Tax=Chitinophaga sp. TaxID=1869181 RepID=UPI0031E17D1E